jgi:hypothetical protein
MDRASESEQKKVVEQAAERTAAILEQARKASEASAEQIDAKVRDAVRGAVIDAAEQAAREAAQQSASQNIKQAIEEVVGRVIAAREASTPSLQILSSPEAANQHLDQWKKSLEETADGVRCQSIEQSRTDAVTASQRLHEQLEAALAGASQRLGEKLSEIWQAGTSQAEQELAARSSSLRRLLDEMAAAAQTRVQSLEVELLDERERVEDAKKQLQEASRSTLEQTRQRFDQLLTERFEEAGQKTDQLVAERTQQIEPVLQNSAQKVVERFSGQLDQTLAPKLDQAQRVITGLGNAEQQGARLQNTIQEQVRQAAEQVSQIQNSVREQMQLASDEAIRKVASQLAEAEQQAARLQNTIQEQVRQAAEQVSQIQSSIREQVQGVSEQAVQESLTRLREETARYPAEIEQASRAALSKVEEELERKSSEAQHETYEALSKASEWYQKKAQATMQSTLERTVEQSATSLRDRAAEVSSLVASELDHYRRTYVEHTQGEIEETAKEVVGRERAKLSEAAEIANATFTDQVHRAAHESLARFEDGWRDTLEKARSDMEGNRAESLEDFQKKLDERMTQGVDQARTFLQSQLVPMLESWEVKREAEKQEWTQKWKRSADESIEQYKLRLEDASNSWLLTSATTLGQKSQTVLDTLAKAAEKRLRETCAEILSGMGDTLKERLLGISATFSSDEDDLPQKPK